MALKTIPMDLNIVLGPKGLGAFVDQECTVPVVSVHWGQVPRGSSPKFDMYLKNTGVEPLNVGKNIPEDISAWGSVAMAPESVSLIAGEVKVVRITISVLPGAATGSQSFTFELVEVS